jgi:hypothetical protein
MEKRKRNLKRERRGRSKKKMRLIWKYSKSSL